MKIPDSSEGWHVHSTKRDTDARTSEEIFYMADAIRFVEWAKNEIDGIVKNNFSPEITKEDFEKNVDKMIDELSKLQESKIDRKDYGHAFLYITSKVEDALKRPLEFDEEVLLEKKFKEKLIN